MGIFPKAQLFWQLLSSNKLYLKVIKRTNRIGKGMKGCKEEREGDTFFFSFHNSAKQARGGECETQKYDLR